MVDAASPLEPETTTAAEPARGGVQFIPRPGSWREGRQPPWSTIPPDQRHVTLDELRAALDASTVLVPPRVSPLEGTGVRASAVLAPLYEEDGQVFVVLTRRAQHLRSHRGEVSFPGGGQDAGETLLETALREAYEETAMDPSAVEIIGELDHLETVMSRSFIVPFVGVLPGRPDLVASPDEVELILHVPLDELLLEGVYREELWGLPPLDRPLIFFEIVGDTIWGATGAMLRNLLAIATGTRWR
jgi:8-oxo-dGTP pyrophosphatase MutT (NUDIX family)